MKFPSILTIAVVIACVVFLSVASFSQATVSKELLIRVDIPFNFVAAGVHLPAGHYSIYRVLTPDVILIESDNHRNAAFVQVRVSSVGLGQHPTTLIFNTYGDRHFLSQVSAGNDHLIQMCSKCREEEELMAKNKQPKAETITAAAH